MSDVVSFTEIYSQRVDLLPGRTLLTVAAPGVSTPAGDTAAAAEIDVVDDGGSNGSGLLIPIGVDDDGSAGGNFPTSTVDDGGSDGSGGVDDDGPGGAVDDGGRDLDGGVDDDGGS